MIEEPYRWVEAVANRREYIETQLATGSPIVALGFRDGILFLTLGRTRQKLFEIYDRIAMGAIGHPGDIERLRLAAIELASTEGFTRSAADVSLRRLAFYSLSPVLKAAFEQIYGAPYLARLLFAEIGDQSESDLILRVEYDGAITTNSANFSETRQDFGVLSGTRSSTELIESYLKKEHDAKATLKTALRTALEAWSVGSLALADDAPQELPTKDAILAERKRLVGGNAIEAGLLERAATRQIRYRSLTDAEVQAAITG